MQGKDAREGRKGRTQGPSLRVWHLNARKYQKQSVAETAQRRIFNEAVQRRIFNDEYKR
jgi:hypothetical protein